jgi:hypothetical protein
LTSLLSGLEGAHKQYADSLQAYDPLNHDGNASSTLLNVEVLCRVKNMQLYCAQLGRAIDEGEVVFQSGSDLRSTFCRITDAFLMGSASERVAGTITYLQK